MLRKDVIGNKMKNSSYCQVVRMTGNFPQLKKIYFAIRTNCNVILQLPTYTFSKRQKKIREVTGATGPHLTSRQGVKSRWARPTDPEQAFPPRATTGLSPDRTVFS